MADLTVQDSGTLSPASGADLSKLLVLIKSARRGFWVFAVYNSVAAREEVIKTVKSVISPLPVFDWTYSPENPYPISYLKQLTDEQKRNQAVVFFFDLERGDADAWKSLDYSREEFAAHPHALVFWTTGKGRVDAARRSPHFWAQRSGTLDFVIVQPDQQLELMGAWAGQALDVATYTDAERQLRLFLGLLDEYRARPETSARTIAELDGKVGWLLNFLDRRDEAIPCLEEQIEIARKLGDTEMEAEALTNLAVLRQIHTGRFASIELLNQALALATSGRLRADILFNLGSAICQEGRADESLKLLDESLELFKQVGSNLGQANVLQAIGDVQSFRDEKDAALASYASALTLFKQVGDNLGQANVLLALARSNGNAEQFEAAIKLYEKIGDRYSIARSKAFYGQWLIEAGKEDRAIALLFEAREGFLQINFEPGVNFIDDLLAAIEEENDEE